MKAVMITKYGSPDVIQIKEVERPVPKDHEVLIKIKATVVAPPDCAFRKGDPWISRLFTGLTHPKYIPGDVLAGIVEAAGKEIKQLKKGDRVYGSSGTHFRTNAEYIVLTEEEALAKMPIKATFEEAAAVSEGVLTALPFLRDHGRIKSGQRVLINGASGGVGVYAVQLAKYFGAEVTGVCSTTNVEMVKALGADKIIDYTQVDFTKTGECYDIIFDAVGKSSFGRCKKALTPKGRYLTTVPSLAIIPQMLWTSIFKGKKAIMAATGLRKPEEKKKDLLLLNKLMEKGYIQAVIDRQYPLEQMAEAHRYVDTGHKKGSVVILC